MLSKRYDHDKIIYNEGKRELVKIPKMNVWRHKIVNIKLFKRKFSWRNDDINNLLQQCHFILFYFINVDNDGSGGPYKSES